MRKNESAICSSTEQERIWTRSQVIGAGIFLGLAPGIRASSVHSTLKDSRQLEVFRETSEKLRCVCGRNMPISYINDIGHCNTWPMRAVIDGLVAEGRSSSEILKGFHSGFGDIVDTHPAFQMARSAEYAYLVPGLKAGYGNEILSEPVVGSPAIWAGLFASAAIAFGALFIKKRNRGLEEQAAGSQAPGDAEKLKKIYDYDE